MRFRDLGSGQDLPDVIEDVYYGSAWSADSATLFYVRPDQSMRPWQVWRHRIGDPELMPSSTRRTTSTST